MEMSSPSGLSEDPGPDRYPPPLLVPPSFLPSSMGKEKEKSRIDIILDAPYISLQGTAGTTVEPAVLSGRVSLYLVEDTDIREVSLYLRGKAKIPGPTTESYTFCSHDWSFLESTCNSSSPSSHVSSGKRPSPQVRTLKAGRHVFPFTFTLNGDFPSTLTTHPVNVNSSTFPTNTRASTTYKLRAVASRPGLSFGPGPLHNLHITPRILHNLTCTMPVHVLRSLSPVALEYQQSLEMENTWPEKLMYAIMLPHRAWAAGDTLIAVLKLSPLAKGVWVENIVTSLWESTELHVPQNNHPKNAPHRGDKSKLVHSERRIVRCVKHEIVNGKAVRVDLVGAKTIRGSSTPAGSASRTSSRPGSAMDHFSSGATSDSRASIDTRTPSSEEENQFPDEVFENHDVVTYIAFPIPHLATGPYMGSPTAAPPSMTPGSSTSTSTSFSSTYSYSPTPLSGSSGSSAKPPPFSPSSTATILPTHNLSPIEVSHRIRWSLSIHNPDGHISELRCSLPIHILDGRLLSEAREASVLTRRMALVAEGLWRGDEDEEHLALGRGAEELNENGGDIYVDRELPSYTAHVRDRVANMFYSEMATVRVPWLDVVAGGECTTTDILNWDDNSVDRGASQSRRHSHSLQRSSRPASGRNTPGYPPANQPHQHHRLPQAPSTSSNPSPLEWVNSELMSLSLSSREMTQNKPHESPQAHSEMHSRSGSPERNPAGSSCLSTVSDGCSQEPGSVQPVKSLSGLLKATMKPFTALTHQHASGGHGLFGPSKSSSPQDDVRQIPPSGPSSRHTSPTRRASIPSTQASTSSFPSGARSHPSQSPFGTSSTTNRRLSEVPNYSVASRGFMGGVPPLSSLVGLPSYEEAAREHQRQPQADHDGDPHDRDRDLEGPLLSPGPPLTTNNTRARETASDTDLLGRFGGSSRLEIRQRLESTDSTSTNFSGSDDEDKERIQMRTRARDQH